MCKLSEVYGKILKFMQSDVVDSKNLRIGKNAAFKKKSSVKTKEKQLITFTSALKINIRRVFLSRKIRFCIFYVIFIGVIIPHRVIVICCQRWRFLLMLRWRNCLLYTIVLIEWFTLLHRSYLWRNSIIVFQNFCRIVFVCKRKEIKRLFVFFYLFWYIYNG